MALRMEEMASLSLLIAQLEAITLPQFVFVLEFVIATGLMIRN